MSSIERRRARFGPFHRRCEAHPDEVENVCSSGQVWGRPRRNFFAGLIPAVKAWDGPLPADPVGMEFYTDVPPDPWSIPGWPEWTEGQPGVLVLEAGELVAIPVVVTMKRTPDDPMRVAKPNELKSHAYPVLSAAISEAELSRWFPVPFLDITDPQEAAEPSKAALIKLDAGDYFVLYYGRLSNQLMLRIPTSTDASTFLDSFFGEVPLPRARIVWRRQDARLPRHIAAKTIVAPASTAARSRPASSRRTAKAK